MDWAKIPTVSHTEIHQLSTPDKAYYPYNHSEYIPAKGWPTGPTPLRRPWRSRILPVLLDLTNISVSLLLIFKVCLVVAAWHSDKIYHGTTINLVWVSLILIALNAQMVTAFPIVFMLIIGTFVKRYALWKAQKGAYLRELELLHGSTSLPSTIRLIFSLKARSITAVALFAIWSFYYIGSQASGREYNYAPSDPQTYQYIGVSDIYRPSLFDSAKWNDSADSSSTWKMSKLYRAMDADWLFVDVGADNVLSQKVGTDMYGLSLVPNIHVLLDWINGPSTDQQNDWMIASEGTDNWVQVFDLSMLQQTLGADIWVSRSTLDFYTYEASAKSTNFAVKTMMLGRYQYSTAFFNIECGLPSLQPYDAFPNGTLDQTMISVNMTPASSAAPRDFYSGSLRSFEFWNRWENTPVSFANVTTPTEDGLSAVATCNISSTYVDVKVSCTAAGCSPDAVRFQDGLSVQRATNYSTAFDEPEFAERFLSAFSASPLVFDVLTYNSSFEAYLSAADPEALSTQAIMSGFTTKLSTLLNTFYTTSQVFTVATPDMRHISEGDNVPDFVAAEFTGAPWDPRYEISWPWIALDFFSCGILLAAAIASMVLRHRTLAPDIFGYVSSLTRDNPHLRGAIPDNGTGLDGIERAKMMKDVKVKIGDVSGDTSHVARVRLAVVKIRGDNGTGYGQNAPRTTPAHLTRTMTVV